MQTVQTNDVHEENERKETLTEAHHERWAHWPVNWSAIWVGALSAIAAVLLFGLIGVALGAHLLDPEQRVVDLKKIGLFTLAFSVFSAFLSFVIGGWVAGKIAGILHSEPAMLHGAIVWALAMPLLVILAGLGAAHYMGGWYGGLAGTSVAVPYERPEMPGAGATTQELAQYRTALTEYQSKVHQWREETPRVTRNSALGALTALLLGLMGSVIGGWMASGEPMTLTYQRPQTAPTTPRQQQVRVRL